MISRTFVIRNSAGMHLKPATLLCTEAIKYDSAITLSFGNMTTNAKSVLNVLGACIRCHDSVVLTCDGADEEEAMQGIARLFESGFGELAK